MSAEPTSAEIIESLRAHMDGSCWDHVAEDAARRIESLSAENERLRRTAGVLAVDHIHDGLHHPNHDSAQVQSLSAQLEAAKEALQAVVDGCDLPREFYSGPEAAALVKARRVLHDLDPGGTE